MIHMEHLSEQMQRCIDDCMACHTACEETLSQCIGAGGAGADGRLMRMLMDCAELSRMCADMMMRSSELAGDMARLCARMCDMCAEACEAMAPDAMMARCAEACRRCAESCRMSVGAVTA